MNARGVAHQNRDRDDRAARHERPEQAPEERRAVLAVLAVLALAPRTATRRRAIAAVVAPARGGGSAACQVSATRRGTAARRAIRNPSCGFGRATAKSFYTNVFHPSPGFNI